MIYKNSINRNFSLSVSKWERIQEFFAGKVITVTKGSQVYFMSCKFYFGPTRSKAMTHRSTSFFTGIVLWKSDEGNRTISPTLGW